jgi:hypothetical protein
VAAAAQAPIAVLGQAWTLSQVSLLAGCAHLVCGMRVLEYVCKAVQPTSHANPPCLRACLPACLSADEAGFGLSFNGSVIDLSSSFQPE